jgi:hypothetical protein
VTDENRDTLILSTAKCVETIGRVLHRYLAKQVLCVDMVDLERNCEDLYVELNNVESPKESPKEPSKAARTSAGFWTEMRDVLECAKLALYLYGERLAPGVAPNGQLRCPIPEDFDGIAIAREALIRAWEEFEKERTGERERITSENFVTEM